MTTEKSLHEFMEEAELDHYYTAIRDQLKINAIHQLKYVEEEDLVGIGMTKPEMRRLKKMYRKEFPAGALGKLKKAILTRSGGDIGRPLSPSPPEQRSPRPSSYIRPPSKQIIPADSIQINKTLGEGEFGVVQQGLWTTETGEKVQVAIKCLTKEKMHTGTTEFLKEANIMQNIDHENIVRMYGVVLDKDESLMLVTELAPMRSLLECLKEPSLRSDFPLPRLCDFAQEICDGMSYLESKRLIHRDLAARNILVFSKSKVKISDFGLSRALGIGKDYYQSNFSLNLKLPIAWCAPECINYLKFTSASDVWAFGVTLWELFTYGFQPWAGLTGQQILEAIDTPNSQRLERPDLCPKEYYQIMMKCWEHDSERRPLFSELFVMLPQMRPTQVKALKDFPEVVVPKEYLYYKAYDIIYVIDKNPTNCPQPGLWKGALGNGKYGYFDPTNAMPIIEHKSSPLVSKAMINRKDSKRENGDANIKLTRKESKKEGNSILPKLMRRESKKEHGDSNTPKIKLSRKESDKKEKSPNKKGGKKESKRNSLRKLNVEMISGPQNDLRHTGHIGYDGAIFGDVGFIGDNYDKLPVKVSSTGKDGESRISTISLNRESPDDGHMNGTLGTNGHSWISQESIDSAFITRSDEVDSGDQYQDIDEDSIFADFKMPDISSSFDFGPSFMDEVLKAISDKEAKLTNSSSNDSSQTTTPQAEQPPVLNGRSPPPPLPVQPPRLEPRKEPPKPEPRKQAKVKPMSASDEKMMDNAIAMANELTSRSHKMQEPTSPKSESESDPESPQNSSRFKFSFKRSPKLERQRTFSEEIKNKTEQADDVPPEAMEAYNMLVQKGSVKDKSDSVFSHSSVERDHYRREITPPKREVTPVKREITPVKREIAPVKREFTPPQREVKPVQNDFSVSNRESTPVRQNSVPIAMADDFDLDSSDFSSQFESHFNQKPVPKPRPEVKKSEIPVPAPKPRPEIIQRVEPVPRPQKPPPQVPLEYDLKVKLPEEEEKPKLLDTSSEQVSECDSEDLKNSVDVLRIDEPDSDNTHTDSGTESVNSAPENARHEEVTRRDSYKSSSLFDEEFSEPSPREIMSKLARESRIRRSLDHQRGMYGSGDEGPSRNIREPQGIPGKGASSNNGGEGGGDEEVDTNPLRMLRGGAIPIRGGRVGQGMPSKPNNSKLSCKIPTLHHSMSVDSGTVEHDNERDVTNTPARAPVVPPRSNSVSGEGRNSIPVPPRRPLRQSTPLRSARERKFPLHLEESDPGSTPKSLVRTYAWSESDTMTQHEHTLPPAPPPPLKSHLLDDKPFDSGLDEEDDVFESHDVTPPSTLVIDTSKSSSFPHVQFQFQNVKCSLEQLGFYNQTDPFWGTTLTVGGRTISDRGSSEEVSPLMLANYKRSDGVSYEDLLDFAYDREKNCEEIERMLSMFNNEISVEDCEQALTETKWNVPMAIKYVKLKQLLSAHLGDITLCKEALMACDWDVQRAANHILSNLSSPEIIDV